MKIAIIGHGKMGRLVEELALNRGHEIVGVVDLDKWEDHYIKDADVAIEFTSPDSAVKNICKCF